MKNVFLLLVNGALLVNQGYFCQLEPSLLSVSLFSVKMSRFTLADRQQHQRLFINLMNTQFTEHGWLISVTYSVYKIHGMVLQGSSSYTSVPELMTDR